MSIYFEIDGVKIEAIQGESIASAAARAGIGIPRLCNTDADSHRAGCMVCAVFDKSRNAFFPSCAAKADELMELESSSQRVSDFRKEALSLLLAEHRGDCVAPCKKACPYGFDIPRFLEKLTARDFMGAQKMLYRSPQCETCKAPCQTVCRRKFVDEAVKIAELILKNRPRDFTFMDKASKNRRYSHNFGKPSAEDLKRFAETTNDVNRCLQCHCKKEDDCRLRDLAEKFEMPQPKQAKIKDFDRARANGVVIEKAKCILCCACSQKGGLAIRGRAHKAFPDKPDGTQWGEVLWNCHVDACPTGAIAFDKTSKEASE